MSDDKPTDLTPAPRHPDAPSREAEEAFFAWAEAQGHDTTNWPRCYGRKEPG